MDTYPLANSVLIPSGGYLLFNTRYPALLGVIGCIVLSQVLTSVCRCSLKYRQLTFYLHILMIAGQYGAFIYFGEMFTLKKIGALAVWTVSALLLGTSQPYAADPKDD